MKLNLQGFKSKKELFAYLIKNKAELIDLKKSTVKFADCFGTDSMQIQAQKTLNTHFTDDVKSGVIKRTIIANTYNWMDSHDDVHLDGLFSKSIKEREGRIRHLHDHIYQLTAKVGTPEKIYEKSVQWTNLGINKFGYTQALFMDSNIEEELNKQMFKSYLKGEIDQHSVGMNYIKMELAVNDDEYKEEFAAWNKYLPLIGNKEKAEDKGYFWAVKEAKLIEISAVFEGSNELTGTVQNITPEEAGKATSQKEADEQMKKKNLLINLI